MMRHTRLPERRIIVNDGSTDRTAAIIDRAARRHPWIEAHHIARNRPRAEGGESVIKRHLLPQLTGGVWVPPALLALTGNHRAEHLFAFKRNFAADEFLLKQIAECDTEIEALLRFRRT